jgi:hypothetical protein
MTIDEAAKVLLRASGVDGRKAGELQARMWAQLLADVEYDDAIEAVDRHYATNEKWLMPVHVIEGAQRIRDERIGRARRAALDAQIAAENPGEITQRDMPAITAGASVAVDDDVRAERRRLLQRAAHTKREQVEQDASLREAQRERMEQARAELAALREKAEA